MLDLFLSSRCFSGYLRISLLISYERFPPAIWSSPLIFFRSKFVLVFFFPKLTISKRRTQRCPFHTPPFGIYLVSVRLWANFAFVRVERDMDLPFPSFTFLHLILWIFDGRPVTLPSPLVRMNTSYIPLPTGCLLWHLVPFSGSLFEKSALLVSRFTFSLQPYGKTTNFKVFFLSTG